MFLFCFPLCLLSCFGSYPFDFWYIGCVEYIVGAGLNYELVTLCFFLEKSQGFSLSPVSFSVWNDIFLVVMRVPSSVSCVL